MRTIAARERRRAIEERKADAVTPPAARGAGWSTKAAGKRRPSAIERQQAEGRAEDRRLWARKHPAIASAERDMRKGRVEMLKRWDHKRDGTPETHEHASRTNQGALARLWQSGAIDADQLAAAVEIATVAERIGSDVAVRTASLETRVDTPRYSDGSFHERLSQVRHEMAYTRWRGQVAGPIGAVLDMLVGETIGFSVVATRYRMHHRRAKKLLIDALDLWPQVLREVCKEVDHATLAAAQAGIL